jgi:broad specificity phosphatase PhoE
MKTRILLIRHGATAFSDQDRFAGSVDIELSEKGRELARRLAERLAKVKIDAFYCSDMKRTMETASIVARPHGRSPLPVAGLREIDHGKWEGLVHQEVEKKFAAEFAAWAADPFTVAPPGGETGLHVLSRALPALRQIVVDHPDKTVLVVAHKATNRLLLCSLLGIDPREYRERVAQDLACLNVLDFKDPSHAEAIVLNDTSHCGNSV